MSVLSRSVPLAAAVAIGFVVGHFTAPSHDSKFQADPSPSPTRLVAAPGADYTGVPTPASSAAIRRDETLSAERRWKEWSSTKRSQQVESELCAALEEIAKKSPGRAMELAAKEPNLHSRELLRRAALRGWAAVDPNAAVAAAMNLRGMDNRSAIAAVLEGAADNSATVIRLARPLTNGTDSVAIDYGNLAIAALAERGHFEDALRFATEGQPSNRAQWINEAFGAWARAQPQEALAAFQRIADPATRRDALPGLVAGWAEADPASLAEYALHETSAEDRAMELGQTLTNWALRDPGAASAWLSQRDPDPVLDRGLAAVANLPALIAQRPEVATEWAEAISDPQQRQAALRAIGDEWRRRAPSALAQFLQGGSRLTEADHAALAGTADVGAP